MTAQKNLEVKGSILDYPLAEILAEIAQSNLTGSLRLSNSEKKIVIYFDGGEVIFASSNSRQHRLFHILLREEKITAAELTAIPDFANDQVLQIGLLKKEIFAQKELNDVIAVQIRQILQDALEWQEGSWVFSPLVRIKDGIRITVDVPDLLFAFGRQMTTEKIVRRFKSLQERFGRRAELPVHINLLPPEAFICSRFDHATYSIEEIKNLTGLAEAENLRTLYILWLGGFLLRQRWNSAFSPENLSAIQSAKIELKSKAFAPTPFQEKSVADKSFAEKKQAEKAEKEISLDEYLERIETAATYYEILDVSTEAGAPEIKAAYFGLAKRFHPDLFYRRVEEQLHRRIQNAFTRLAQAYETLRNTESREVYDFKMRKETAHQSKHPKTNTGAAKTQAEIIQEQAAENFEQGFDLIVQEEYEEAVSFLARAVHLAGGNARYRAYYGKALSANKETYRQAEAEFQAALRLEPDNVDYRLMLVRLFVKIGLVKRAEGELKRILEKSPKNPEALSLLDSLLG